jgi:hypothetical protein
MTHTVVGNTEENAMPWHNCAPLYSESYPVGALLQCDVCGKLWVVTRYENNGNGLTMYYRTATWTDKRKARKIARKAGRDVPNLTIGR